MSIVDDQSRIMDLIWNDVKNILDALFPKNISASPTRPEGSPGIPEHFASHGTSPHIYPVICRRIDMYVSNYYKNVLLPHLLPLQGFDLLKALRIKWHTCKHVYSLHLRDTLNRFYDVHVRWFPDNAHLYLNITSLARSGFERCIYNEFANTLREGAYKCIKDDFHIVNESYLQQYFSFIESLSCSSNTFCRQEWENDIMNKITIKLPDLIASWCDSFSQFLSTVERNLPVYKSIFILEESKKLIEERLLNAAGPTRNSLLFRNGGATLNDMLQVEENLSDLKRLARLFGHDKTLIHVMEQHYTKYFKSYICGESEQLSSILKPEDSRRAIRRILILWGKISTCQIVVGQSKMIHSSMVDPFMTMLSPAEDNFDFTRRLETSLANYMEELLFHPHPIFQMDVESEMWKLLSLVTKMPFPDTLVCIVGNTLRENLRNGWSPNNNAARAAMEYLHCCSLDLDSIPVGCIRMLRDVQSWPLHTYEMKNQMRDFNKKYPSKVELQVIRQMNWPNLSIPSQLRLPSCMAEYEKIFQQYFTKEYEERVASIDSFGGGAVIKCLFWTFRGENVRIEGCTGQVCVMDQFQQPGPKRVGDICKNVALDQGYGGKNVVIGILESLMETVPVLVRSKCNNNGGPLQQDDMLEINFSYTPGSPLIRLPVPKVSDQSKNENAEGKGWMKDFFAIAVQAMIMRCLKENRVMEMGDLERVVSEKLLSWYDAREIGAMFAEVVGKLTEKMYIESDDRFIRYVPC